MSVSAAHFKEVTNGYEKRTDGLWTHTGKLRLPDGSITTQMLAANATSALIGSNFANPTWSTTTTGSWVGTVVSTGSISCSGALCRIEFSGSFTHSATGGAFYTGLMLDNVALYGMSVTNVPLTNYSCPVAWILYYYPSTANHTFQLMVLNITGGTLSLLTNTNTALYVTEQRR